MASRPRAARTAATWRLTIAGLLVGEARCWRPGRRRSSRRPPSTAAQAAQQPGAALLEPLEAQRVAEPPDTRRDRLGREPLCRVRQGRDRLVEEPDREEPLERVRAARAPADPRDAARRQVDGPACRRAGPPRPGRPTGPSRRRGRRRRGAAAGFRYATVCSCSDPVGQVRGECRHARLALGPGRHDDAARLDGLRVRAAQADLERAVRARVESRHLGPGPHRELGRPCMVVQVGDPRVTRQEAVRRAGGRRHRAGSSSTLACSG